MRSLLMLALFSPDLPSSEMLKQAGFTRADLELAWRRCQNDHSILSGTSESKTFFEMRKVACRNYLYLRERL
jgi:hypothetical protein